MISGFGKRWKVVLVAIAAILAPAGIVYAIMTQAVKTVPATASFVAGVELATENIAVTYDPEGVVAGHVP